MRTFRFNIPYKDQLKTSAWLRKKYEIMDRDNFVCSVCLCDNYENRLDVHHITYDLNRMAWEYPDYLLVTLCKDCHKKKHDDNNIFKPNIIRRWIEFILMKTTKSDKPKTVKEPKKEAF